MFYGKLLVDVVKDNKIVLIKYLLRKLANIILRKCLRLAIRSGKISVVEMLLKAGLNPNSFFNGQTPLHLVANGKKKSPVVNLCQLLISYGAELDVLNANGETPLVTAVKRNKANLVKYLLDKGANPNCGGCLNHALKIGNANVVEYILRKGANPNYYFYFAFERNLLENWLRKQFQINIDEAYDKKYKSNELLTLLSIWGMCQPDCILGSLKEKSRKKISEGTDYSRIYSNMQNLGLNRSCQYYIYFKDELEVFDLNFKTFEILADLFGKKRGRSCLWNERRL